MLSYMTCGERGNWSDSWYCNEEYDALFEQQRVEQDDAARQEQVKQMQEMLYYDAPYLVTAYSTIGEAWRSDRFACLGPQPDPGGVYLVQYGVHNYVNMRPASEADECAGEEGATAAQRGGRRRGRCQHRVPGRRRGSSWSVCWLSVAWSRRAGAGRWGTASDDRGR